MPDQTTIEIPRVYLIGAGVVGRAILQAHIDSGVSVWIVDLDADAVEQAVAELALPTDQWHVSDLTQIRGLWPAIELCSTRQAARSSPTQGSPSSSCIVIESISERLEIKQEFFSQAEQVFGDKAVLCSNTSTLRITAIADSLAVPERFCGMHFFMPVYNRTAVEVIGGERTSKQTIEFCKHHVLRIKKEPLIAGDGPGFAVNRLLTPYLNEAMLMLGRGIPADQIERAALAYGMPMSPLELIDWIGTRTLFDAGRVYWQSFPTRLSPAPMLAAMVKRKRFGRACGAGLYNYSGETRSADLAPETHEFCEEYRRNEMSLRDEEVTQVLSIPMWIEAAIAFREGVVPSSDRFDLAMQGGLGFSPGRSWHAHFDSIGSPTILEAIEKWSTITAAMNAPQELKNLLSSLSPRETMEQYANA